MIKLYRGKTKDEDNWIKGYVWEGADHVYITPHNLGVAYEPEDHEIKAYAYEVIRETITQDSGLDDKDLFSIYDGDIIEHDNLIGLVKCVKGTFIVTYPSTPQVNYLFVVNDKCKKIGNKWDNPELIKKDK